MFVRQFAVVALNCEVANVSFLTSVICPENLQLIDVEK